jgi:hypothetical protein
LWVSETADLGRKRLLLNNTKEREIPVVTVVRGAKVEIEDLIARDAGSRPVHALENQSRRTA